MCSHQIWTLHIYVYYGTWAFLLGSSLLTGYTTRGTWYLPDNGMFVNITTCILSMWTTLDQHVNLTVGPRYVKMFHLTLSLWRNNMSPRPVYISRWKQNAAIFGQSLMSPGWGETGQAKTPRISDCQLSKTWTAHTSRTVHCRVTCVVFL